MPARAISRQRTLSAVGEAGLIARIARRAGRTPGEDWALRIGDDAAILRPREGDELVLSTDALVEDVHFRFGRETPRAIGRRALAVNLSDLAAMGAEPVGALLALSAPREASIADFDGVVDGFAEEAERYGCPLVGGNLAQAAVWTLAVTIVGRCPVGRALRRRGDGEAALRPGDALFVTGRLGGATLARERADRTGRRLTRVPVPRLEAGQRLAETSGVLACIDLSDGLATDLGHLLEDTGWGAEIDPEAIPRDRDFARQCRRLDLDPLRVITLGGEDYELLFAFRPERNDPTETEWSESLGVPVTRVGTVTERTGIRGFPGVEARHHF